MSSEHLSEQIKAEAKNLGFFACGIAKAAPVGHDVAEAFGEWLSQGGNADMAYMANHADKRLNPSLLMPGVKSIVSVALSYAPQRRMPPDQLQLSVYAYGHDYHDLMKAKLRALAASIDALHPAHMRCFCDTAPVLERYWAVQAGLGWIGRNRQLIIPHAGSMFFLGELFLDIDLQPDAPMTGRCGHCRACLDACPTGALGSRLSDFNATACLSYQTIENRGPLSPAAAKALGSTIYGCDRCQAACPHNSHARPTTEPLLQPSPSLLSMTRNNWRTLTIDDYRRLFRGSAVKRAKYEGLMRNIAAALNNETN